MSVFKSTATGVAVITPFNNKGAVDFDALSRIIHYLIDSGIDFLVALGTTRVIIYSHGIWISVSKTIVI